MICVSAMKSKSSLPLVAATKYMLVEYNAHTMEIFSTQFGCDVVIQFV